MLILYRAASEYEVYIDHVSDLIYACWNLYPVLPFDVFFLFRNEMTYVTVWMVLSIRILPDASGFLFCVFML